jgi:hypothetical protein
MHVMPVTLAMFRHKTSTALKILTILYVTTALLAAGCAAKRNLSMYAVDNAQCYDRNTQASTFAVDSHNHFRPFGGEALAFSDLTKYFNKLGIVFVNVYGIGQTLSPDSGCEYFTQCPGTPVLPNINNDMVNADSFLKSSPTDVHLTLSMSFPDLAEPTKIVTQMKFLDTRYPDLFKWMGEVNLVKQALFNNGHLPTPVEKIAQWKPFMTILRARNMPISIHSDLGNDKSPTQYSYLMDEVLKQYPHNKIVWVHMGLSKELSKMNPEQHIALMKSYLNKYPNLMLDISWHILYYNYFDEQQSRELYVDFFNQYSTRILPGSDFVATAKKTFSSYKSTVKVNSLILEHLNDQAFRNIALGQNYIQLLGLNYKAPDICH